MRRSGALSIGRRIGAGGMATVFAALQRGPGGVSRLVAVKLIAPAYGRDASFRKMFLREARIAARLEHPNIVRVYEVAEIGEELQLAMELVHGATLSSLMRAAAGPLPVPIAARVVADAARGLHAAHEVTDADGVPLGLVHQDVSPQNILVGYDGATKLLDFGVARLGAEDLSRTETVRGKPAYLAPEQLAGEKVDRRTDVFALGIVLYELLTGQRLFSRGSLAETHLAVAAHADVDPAAMTLVAGPIADVVRRALRRAPADRFASAEAMRAALIEACDSAGVRLADEADTGAWARATTPPDFEPPEIEREILAWESERAAEISDLPTIPPSSRRPRLVSDSSRAAGTSSPRVLDAGAPPRFWRVAMIAALVGGLSAYGLLRSPSTAPLPPLPLDAPSRRSVTLEESAAPAPAQPGPPRCRISRSFEALRLPNTAGRLTLAAYGDESLLAVVHGKDVSYARATAGGRSLEPLRTLRARDVPGKFVGLALASADGLAIVDEQIDKQQAKPTSAGGFTTFFTVDHDGAHAFAAARQHLVSTEIAAATSPSLTILVAVGRDPLQRGVQPTTVEVVTLGPRRAGVRTDDLRVESFDVLPAVAIGATRGLLLTRESDAMRAYWFDLVAAAPKPLATAAVGKIGRPAVAFAGDTALALWPSRGSASEPFRLHGAAVAPRDGAWAPPFRLGDLEVSDAASIAVSDALVYVAWIGLRGGVHTVHVGATRRAVDDQAKPVEDAKIDLAAAFDDSTIVSETVASEVQVAASGRHAWLAWSHGDQVELAQIECR
jgi:serine/threonine-protein kinase